MLGLKRWSHGLGRTHTVITATTTSAYAQVVGGELTVFGGRGGGGLEFTRPWVEEVYGILPEQVVGSSIKTEFELGEGQPVLRRLPELDFLDDKVGKPVAIHKFIGRRPIAAFGNSDGDLQMLQWTAGGSGARLQVLIHHTDEAREWSYDRDSHIGRLDQIWDIAVERGWTVIDMRRDWRQIYPFDQDQ